LSSPAFRKTTTRCSSSFANGFAEAQDAARYFIFAALAIMAIVTAAKNAAAADGLRNDAKAIGFINKAWRQSSIMQTASAPISNARSSKK
jgi:hypothetical protein